MDVLTARYRELEKLAQEREQREQVWKAAEEVIYLAETHFDSANNYEVRVDGAGLIVFSECCADRMSDETARKVYEALGRYLATRDAQGA